MHSDLIASAAARARNQPVSRPTESMSWPRTGVIAAHAAARNANTRPPLLLPADPAAAPNTAAIAAAATAMRLQFRWSA